MKIESSALAMSSQHQAASSHSVKETMNAWVGSTRPDFEGMRRRNGEGARVSISPEALAAQAQSQAQASSEATAVSADSEDDSADPFVKMVKTVVEMLVGHKIDIFDAKDFNKAQQAGSGAGGDVGYGVEYDREESYSESEQTSFQATGVVRTADGKEIGFNIGIEMSRSYSESSSTSLRIGNAVRKDPLVINFNGNSAQLQDTRFKFDLEGDGKSENIAMLAQGSAYIALDKNNNGKVDDGRELFGTTSGNGFADLAKLDGDGNGWLDDNDAAFGQLKAWVPDGQGGGSLQSLKDMGVGAISLLSQNTPFELKNSSNESLGAVRSSGVFLNENGSAGTVQQIDLSV